MKYVSCEDTDPQKHTEFRSWDGKSVKQIEVNHPDRYAIYEFMDALPEEEKEELLPPKEILQAIKTNDKELGVLINDIESLLNE